MGIHTCSIQAVVSSKHMQYYKAYRHICVLDSRLTLPGGSRSLANYVINTSVHEFLECLEACVGDGGQRVRSTGHRQEVQTSCGPPEINNGVCSKVASSRDR